MDGLHVSVWCSELSARHPQWWALTLSALGWLVLVLMSGLLAIGPAPLHCHVCTAEGMGEPGPRAVPLWVSDGLHSFAMAMAMMLPLTISSVRVVAFRSLWTHRHRAVAAFLIGYLACWVCTGWLTGVLLRSWRSMWTGDAWMWVSIGLWVAAVWELTPIKRWGWRACHRTEPLAPRGWRATWTCVRFGCRQGCGCVASCGALMLLPMLVGHSLVAMAGSMLACLLNRYRPEHRPALVAGVLVACASVTTTSWVLMPQLGGP